VSAAAPLPAEPSPVPATHESDGLEALRRRTAAFVEAWIRPNAEAWERGEELPRALFQEAGRLGLFGLKYERALGGSGRPYRHTVAYLEELARGGAWGTMLSLVIHGELATPLLQLAGSAEQKARWLAPAIRGESICAIAMTEPTGGSDLGGLRTLVVPGPDGVRVHGRKFMIGNGSRADVVCVLGVTSDDPARLPRLAAALVPRGTPGFRVVRRLEKVGLEATDNCELAFEDCRVPLDHLVGRPGRLGGLLARANAFERLALAASSVGAMQAVWEHAVAFAREREVQGRPLLAHPLWRHRFARDRMRIEAARRLVLAAADTMDGARPDLTLATMAKILATETLQRVAARASQALGARGFLREELAARTFVDARALTVGGGTSEVLTELLAALVL
jgi:alkylation response protein AidB-like acyl-CoA dehydrogenase